MSLLEMKNIKKSFNGVEVLKDISLKVEKGEVLGIICLLYTSPSPRD